MKYPDVNGFSNRQYDFDGLKKKISFAFKGQFIEIDLTTPEAEKRAFEIEGVKHYLIVDYKQNKHGEAKWPKFYIVNPDNRDNDKKLRQGITRGGCAFLESPYYGTYT